MKALRKAWLAEDNSVHLSETDASIRQIELEFQKWLAERFKDDDPSIVTAEVIALVSKAIAEDRLKVNRILDED
jgi:hypothetical protein